MRMMQPMYSCREHTTELTDCIVPLPCRWEAPPLVLVRRSLSAKRCLRASIELLLLRLLCLQTALGKQLTGGSQTWQVDHDTEARSCNACWQNAWPVAPTGVTSVPNAWCSQNGQPCGCRRFCLRSPWSVVQ